MPRYTYTAKTQPRNTIQGAIEAETKQEAIDKLTKMGYFPMDVILQDAVPDKQSPFVFKKISSKEIVLFTRQLSSLIDSGINIINALNIISHQAANKYFKAVLDDILARIKDGKSLSESMSHYPKTFSELYSSMIHAGEASGNLKEILMRLSDFLENEEEFRNSLRSALIYPLFVFSVGIITVFVLITFVIPRLAVMFTDMGQILPLPTRILINTSAFMQSWWWFMVFGFFALLFFLRRVFQSPQGRIYLDKLQLRLAIAGPIILKSEISHLTRILSLLLSSGIPITSALEIALAIIRNQILKSETRRFTEEITNGSSLSRSLRSSEFFPEFVTNLVSIGEETGQLDKSLSRIADDYEKDVKRNLAGLTRLLEPAIILFMGLMVSFIVLAMLLPIFQINLIVR